MKKRRRRKKMRRRPRQGTKRRMLRVYQVIRPPTHEHNGMRHNACINMNLHVNPSNPQLLDMLAMIHAES